MSSSYPRGAPSQCYPPSSNWYNASALSVNVQGRNRNDESLLAYAAKDAIVIGSFHRSQSRASETKRENRSGKGDGSDAFKLAIVRHLHGHARGSRVTAVSFSEHDASSFLLASGGSDRKTCIWDTRNGLKIGEHTSHRAEITALASSSLLPGVFVSGDKSGSIVMVTVTAHSAAFVAAAKARLAAEVLDGPMLESCEGDGSTVTGNSEIVAEDTVVVEEHRVRKYSALSDSWVSCIALSPYNAHVVAVGYQSGALSVVDLRTGMPISRLIGHSQHVQGLAWLPESFREKTLKFHTKRKERASMNKTVSQKRHYPKRKQTPKKSEAGPSELPAKKMYSPQELFDLRPLATVPKTIDRSEDATAATATGDKLLLGSHGAPVEVAPFGMPTFKLEDTSCFEDKFHDEDGDIDACLPPLLASSSRDRTIRLWDCKNWRVLGQLMLPMPRGRKKGKKRGGKNHRKREKVYDGEDLSLTSSQKSRLWFTFCWAAPSRRGELQLVSSSWMGELLLWSWTFGNAGWKRRHQGPAFLECSPRVLTAGSAMKGSALGHSRPIFNVKWEPHRKKIITNSMDRKIGIWDFGKRRCECTIPGLGGHVNVVATSPVLPQYVALGVGDQTIRLWDVSEGIGTQTSHNGGVIWNSIQSKVTALTWHPSCEGILAFGTEDGCVGIVDTLKVGTKNEMRFKEAVNLSPIVWLCWSGENQLISLGKAERAHALTFQVSEDPQYRFCATRGVVEINELLARAGHNDLTTGHDGNSSLASEVAAVRVHNMSWSGASTRLLSVSASNGCTYIYTSLANEGPLLQESEVVDEEKNSENKAQLDSPIDWERLKLVSKSKTLHDGSKITAQDWSPAVSPEYSSPSSMDVSDDLLFLASVAKNGSACVSSCNRYGVYGAVQSLPRFVKKKALVSVSWRQQGDMIASASVSGRLGIWGWPQGNLRFVVEAHHDRVLSCAWSFLHINSMYTGSADQTAKIWDIPIEDSPGIISVDQNDQNDQNSAQKMPRSDMVWTEEPTDVDMTSTTSDSSDHAKQLGGNPSEGAAQTVIEKLPVDHTVAQEKLLSAESFSSEEICKEEDHDNVEKQKRVAIAASPKARPERTRGARGGTRGGKSASRKESAKGLSAYELEVVANGELARVIQARITSGNITEQLVALSPSCGMWSEAIIAWARQLENKGKIQDAALAWVTYGNVTRAVELLVEHSFWDLALMFSRQRLGENHPTTKMLCARVKES